MPFSPLSPLLSPSLLSAEDKPPSGGIIPKLPQTPDDPQLLEGHVYPFWGPVCQRYTYSVIYRDQEGHSPEYVQIYFNGQMIDLEKENSDDHDYQKGVRYIYQYVPTKLGSNFYYFEASNGLGKTRASIIDSPDNGPVLFQSAFDHNEIALIDAQSGQKIASFSTAKEWVGGVALSADGQYLAAKTSHHVYLFATANLENPLWEYQPPVLGPIGDDVKGGVAISADGSRIFASLGQIVLLFDQQSSQPLWTYPAGNAYNVAISANGQYVAAGTGGSVYFFESFDQDQQIYPCSAIIEPPPESAMMAAFGFDSGNGNPPQKTTPSGQKETREEIKAPASFLLLLFGSALIIDSLIIISYLAFKVIKKHKNQPLQINKLILIILLTLLFIFLILTAFTYLSFQKAKQRSEQLPSQTLPDLEIKEFSPQKSPSVNNQPPSQNTSSPNPASSTKPVCGNDLCEADFGESKTTCPQDCSGNH